MKSEKHSKVSVSIKNAYQVSPSGVGGVGDVKKNDGAKSEPN